MNISAWFDSLPTAAKIGAVILITLAAMAAAAGFVGSIVRVAGLLARMTGRRRKRNGHDTDGPA